MSTAFKPLEIPPGVVALVDEEATFEQLGEVNLVRWREGQLMPMGGQSKLSECRWRG